MALKIFLISMIVIVFSIMVARWFPTKTCKHRIGGQNTLDVILGAIVSVSVITWLISGKGKFLYECAEQE